MLALQSQDIDAMMQNYSDTFESDQPGGRDGLKEFFESAKEKGFLDELKVDLRSIEIAVDGKKATAKPIGLEAQFGALTLELKLEKIDGSWMVTYQTQY